MSRCFLIDVSNIHAAGKSITTARTASTAISIAECPDRRRRTSWPFGASAGASCSSRWTLLTRSPPLEPVEVPEVDVREDDHDDHHEDPVGRRAAGVEAVERDLVHVEGQRLGRVAGASAGEDVDQVEEAERLDRAEEDRDQ